MRKKQKEFLALYEPIHLDFERFCRARVYGDMEFRDLMNETLLKAFEKFEELRSKEAFLSYLLSISVRLLANNKRKRKEESDSFEKIVIQTQDVNSNTEAKVESYFLHKALAQLPEEQRESIILFEISGFSIKEIAVIQKTSESSVKQRLRRGRIRLRELLTFEAISSGPTEKTEAS
ncbi:MAG: RNA polymerase sigma-70 factor (ECF subfamily) [Crocinitomicaceae bacterium]|jgi:RNA polymerase sigma-70 factor (ECF subfamily)